MDIGEKYLPIGSVVLLKNGTKELMITSYCIMPKGDVYDKGGKIDYDKEKIIDYGACIYPEGILDSDSIIGFNHDNIDKVVFKGYETEASKEFSKLLNENLNK